MGMPSSTIRLVAIAIVIHIVSSDRVSDSAMRHGPEKENEGVRAQTSSLTNRDRKSVDASGFVQNFSKKRRVQRESTNGNDFLQSAGSIDQNAMVAPSPKIYSIYGHKILDSPTISVTQSGSSAPTFAEESESRSVDRNPAKDLPLRSSHEGSSVVAPAFRLGTASLPWDTNDGPDVLPATTKDLPSIISFFDNGEQLGRKGAGTRTYRPGKGVYERDPNSYSVSHKTDLTDPCEGNHMSLVGFVFGERCSTTDKVTRGKGSPKSSKRPPVGPCRNSGKRIGKGRRMGKGVRKSGKGERKEGCLEGKSAEPTTLPTIVQSETPSVSSSIRPTTSSQPSFTPTSSPSVRPSDTPSSFPTREPTHRPTAEPTTQPSSQPTSSPSDIPSSQPTSIPTSTPSLTPSFQPTQNPTMTAVPTMEPLLLATSPFRLQFDGISDSIPFDEFVEMEQLVMRFLHEMFSDLFRLQSENQYLRLEGGTSSFADSHLDFDMDVVFSGSSSGLPSVAMLTSLSRVTLESESFREAVYDLSNSFSTSTSIRFLGST